jgi:hypothetical protein
LGGFLSGIFPSAPYTPPAIVLRVNTALQGVPIPWLLGGKQRLPIQVIDYFDLIASQNNGSPGGKGGVGQGGGKGGGSGYNYVVTFLAALCEGPGFESIGSIYLNGTPLIYAPIPETDNYFLYIPGLSGQPGTSPYNPSSPDLTSVQFDILPGDYEQGIWAGYGIASGQSHALNHRGLVCLGFEYFPLGSSPQIPNITAEVLAANNGLIPGQPDADPSLCASAFLTDPHRGIGFPSARLGDLSQWSSYAASLGLAVSPVLIGSQQASAFLRDLCTATNVAPCWQDGLLTFVPYGDQAVTAGQVQTVQEAHSIPAYNEFTMPNPFVTVEFYATFAGDLGVTYTSGQPLTEVFTFIAPYSPAQGQYYRSGGTYWFNVLDSNQGIFINYSYAATASYTPQDQDIYDFTLDDFLPNQAGIGAGLAQNNDPLTVVRKSRDEMLNSVRVQYLDRSNYYNPVVVEYKNEASIIRFGRTRPSDIKQHNFFCLGAAAQQSCQLQLIREQIARTYQWTCGRHFMLIVELMAVCTLTDPGQGLERQPVRITEIKENEDGSLTISAEDFPGTVNAPEYGLQASTGTPLNMNAAPGSVNAPIIFEPTDELGGGLEIWAGVSGQTPASWGGCIVWVSFDDVNYSRIGVIYNAARMGVTTQDFPAVAVNVTGQTIDAVNTLSVNLTESQATLGSGTVLDATNLNNRCLVGGEIVSYETAALDAQYEYSLSYLVRGAYGTESAIADHPVGTPFLRLDNNIFTYAYQQNLIGTTVYFKFQSFNIFQGGLENLANVAVYPYVITGAALASPLPQIQNLRTVFNDGFTQLDWDELDDFRTPQYEIRVGTSFASALTLGQVAHPPFTVPGDGTYWVAGVCEPTQNLVVYSEAWSSIAISGAVIEVNTVLTYDLKANNWPGVFSGGAGIDNVLNAIRTGGGNILGDANLLAAPDVLDYGGGSSGAYFPTNVYLDIGYLAQASVNITYVPTGVPVGQNILTTGNLLTDPDVLGSASAQFVAVFPQINTATAPTGGDLYSLGDLYQYPDLYEASGPAWNGFQKYSPGVYLTRFLNFAFQLETFDPDIIAYCLAAKITVSIPSRIDSYSLTTSASGLSTVTFQPTGAASAASFNGGPATGSLPAVQGTIIGAQAGDDLIIPSADLTLSGLQVEVLNGGIPVARSIILTVQGY